MYFQKQVNDAEFKMLKKIKKINYCNLLSFHHFLLKNNYILVFFPKKYSFQYLTSIQEKKCITIIFDALDLLHKNRILHLDVHPSNILTNKNKTNFYLIDYGLSIHLPKNFNKTQNLNYFLYILNEDKFQLLWNFYFKTNQMLDDFTNFKTDLYKLPKKKYTYLLKNLYASIFYSKILDIDIVSLLEIYPYSKVKLKTQKQCIIMKLILNRLYFFYHLYFVQNEKNETFRKFIFP